MTDQHPITPPLELVQQWWEATIPNIETSVKDQLCTQAARWGSDQELEACCVEVTWLESSEVAKRMRERRRPKPPSLKEQALALVSHDFSDQPCLSEEGYVIIRKALEALPND